MYGLMTSTMDVLLQLETIFYRFKDLLELYAVVGGQNRVNFA